MAANIGPRIGIDGEKEYRDAIQNIIQQQKTLNSEMKQVASSFDKSAKSSENNKKQMELLNKEITNQEKLVSQLERGYNAAVSKYGETSTAAQKYKQSLVEAKTELSNLQDKLSDMRGADTFESKLEKMSKTLEGFSGKLGEFADGWNEHISGPLINVGNWAMDSFSKVDSGMDTIIKKTGATGDAAEEMGEIMHQIAGDIPADYDQIAESIGEVNTRFHLTGDALKETSQLFTEYAELNDTQVSGSIDGVQKAMEAYNLTADDTNKVLDLFTAVSQATGVSTDGLTNDLIKNQSAFRDLNLDMDDAAWLLGKLEVSAVDSSTVLTGLAKAQAYATKNGQEMSDVLTNAFTDPGKAIDIFGAKAGPKLYEAFQQGKIGVEDFLPGLHDLDETLGTVNDTYAATQDPIDEFKKAMNELAWAGAGIADAFAPFITQLAETLIPKIQEFSEWWSSLDSSTQELIVGIGGVLAVAGPALDIGKKVFDTIGFISNGASGLITAFKGLSEGTGILSAAIGFLTSPIGLAIIAIGLLVGAGVLLYKNWDTIKEWAGKLGESIKNTWENLKTATSEAWNNIKTAISDKFNEAKNTVSDTIGNIVSTMKDKFNSAKDSVVNIFNTIRDKIADAINTARDKVKSAIDRIKSIMNFSWSLPKLKLPHFRISGGFSLMPPSVPHISVDWYKKAYSNAIAFGKPTVVPTASGLKGFGDGNGNEIVIGQNKLLDTFTQAVERAGNTGGNTINIAVYPSEGMDEEELAELVAEKINDSVARAQGVFA